MRLVHGILFRSREHVVLILLLALLSTYYLIFGASARSKKGFAGEEFVRKHIRSKHGECENNAKFFNNFLKDPWRRVFSAGRLGGKQHQRGLFVENETWASCWLVVFRVHVICDDACLIFLAFALAHWRWRSRTRRLAPAPDR